MRNIKISAQVVAYVSLAVQVYTHTDIIPNNGIVLIVLSDFNTSYFVCLFHRPQNENIKRSNFHSLVRLTAIFVCAQCMHPRQLFDSISVFCFVILIFVTLGRSRSLASFTIGVAN